MSKLTLKQQRFVTAYIKTGNASEAVRQAGYVIKNPDANTTAAIAWENLRKPEIADAVTKALTKHELTSDWVLNQIRTIATDLDNVPAKDRLKALELLGKHLKMFSDSNSNLFMGDITIQLGQMPTPSPKAYIEAEAD